MEKAIDDWLRVPHYEHEPSAARARGVAGLCALANGNRKRAVQLAALARESFRVQSAVSPYFKAPSIKLDRLLAAKAK